MTVLLDTNLLIDYLRKTQLAIDYLEALAARPSISVVTVTELYAGAASAREETKIDRLARSCRVLAVDFDIARAAGQFVKHYQPSHGLDDFDALIAATAEHHGLALATLNIKHFPMFPKLKPAY